MKTHCLIFVLLLLLKHPDASDAVGPDLRARSRLLRDLPMGFQSRRGGGGGGSNAAGSGGSNARKEPRRTLIDMSLAVRSIDLDFATGVFSADGWMSLRWQDDRFANIKSIKQGFNWK